MQASVVIGTAIGLILTYFVLSLICTTINEVVATILELRARTLKGALQKIVDDEQLRKDFYNNGLIAGANSAIKSRHVSYMSGTTFALALLASVTPNVALPSFDDVERAIKSMKDTNIRDALLMHLTMAKGDIEKLHDNVAAWFDQTMDRVSGTYKRYLKWISLCVGLALAVAVNADTIAIGTTLWHDDALRQQMTNAADRVIQENEPAGTSDADLDKSLRKLARRMKKAEATLNPLPLGWSFAKPLDAAQKTTTDQMSFGPFALKAGGLVLTALALSLGAPFWFDLLSKFMNLRGTGAKPKRTQDA